MEQRNIKKEVHIVYGDVITEAEIQETLQDVENDTEEKSEKKVEETHDA